MIITLIGMSNIGKSHWTRVCAQAGVQTISIDECINKCMSHKYRGKKFNISDTGNWLGMPYQKGYKDREQTLLRIEQRICKELIDGLYHLSDTFHQKKPLILDTPGSIIYLQPKVLAKLKHLSTCIHLDIKASMLDHMIEQYFTCPKPVYWLNKYKDTTKHSDSENLRRSYPKLLAYRLKKYRKLADITLDYDEVRKPGFSIITFLQSHGLYQPA